MLPQFKRYLYYNSIGYSVIYLSLLNTCGRGPPLPIIYTCGRGPPRTHPPIIEVPMGLRFTFILRRGEGVKQIIGVPDIPFSLGFTQS